VTAKLETPSQGILSPELLDGDKLHPELLLSRLTYTHFVELIRVFDPLQRLFYEVEAIKNNWSVRELKRAVNTQLAFRTTMSTNKEAVIAKIKNLKPTTNVEIIRNPYILEFLDLEEKPEYSETDLEQQILTHLQQFLIELGTGFCFEARQKRITFNNRHYRIDLVFYHRILKCHVLIDLKAGVGSIYQTGDWTVNNYLHILVYLYLAKLITVTHETYFFHQLLHFSRTKTVCFGVDTGIG